MNWNEKEKDTTTKTNINIDEQIVWDIGEQEIEKDESKNQELLIRNENLDIRISKSKQPKFIIIHKHRINYDVWLRMLDNLHRHVHIG